MDASIIIIKNMEIEKLPDQDNVEGKYMKVAIKIPQPDMAIRRTLAETDNLIASEEEALAERKASLEALRAQRDEIRAIADEHDAERAKKESDNQIKI